MTDIKLVNEGGKIVAKDIDTGETVPIYLGETEADALSAGSIQNDVGNAAIQTAWDGLVVPVGPGVGMDAAIDPSATTTPVQDAIDAIPAGEGGAVLLPPETVTEESETFGATGVSIIGWGIGNLPQADSASVIEYPNGGGLTLGTGAEGGDLHIDGLTLKGPGITASASDALTLQDVQMRNIRIGSIGIVDWYGSAFNFDGSSNVFASHFGDFVYVNNVDAGDVSGLMRMRTYGPENTAGFWHLYPQADQSASNSTVVDAANCSLDIRSINVGGSAGVLVDKAADEVYGFRLGSFNYEPNNQQSEPNWVFRLRRNSVIGPGAFNNASGGQSARWGYALESLNHENIVIFPPRMVNGWAFSDNVVRIGDEPAGESWYFGPAGDIDNIAASATGLVRSLADAGTGNG